MSKSIVRRIISTFITVFMLMTFSVTVFAAEIPKESNVPTLLKEYDGHTVKAVQFQNSKDTKAWPGSGPAAQITQVEIVDYGYLNNFPGHEGHFGVVVGVIGHGKDYAKWDGISVERFRYDPIIFSGTLVDGWYNYYDLGVPTEGTHQFEVLMRSHNSPYTEMSARAAFTFTPVEK